jgi:hypothetical protein
MVREVYAMVSFKRPYAIVEGLLVEKVGPFPKTPTSIAAFWKGASTNLASAGIGRRSIADHVINGWYFAQAIQEEKVFFFCDEKSGEWFAKKNGHLYCL